MVRGLRMERFRATWAIRAPSIYDQRKPNPRRAAPIAFIKSNVPSITQLPPLVWLKRWYTRREMDIIILCQTFSRMRNERSERGNIPGKSHHHKQRTSIHHRLSQTTCPPMGRERQRSPSPRGRRHDARHEHRRRDRSRDDRSSTHRDVEREDKYDARHRQPSRDRSRGRSSDEDRREKSKKCVPIHLRV
jgi:hypothetical protein